MANASPIARQDRAVMEPRDPRSAPGAGALPEDEENDQRAAEDDRGEEDRRDNGLPARKPLIFFVHSSPVYQLHLTRPIAESLMADSFI